ncbi:MAG: phosphoribosylamine--glycine ligase [Alphaproteobacteria bacterium]
MKILVTGSGGREHTLCWKINQSPLCTDLYCCPGNAGLEGIATAVPIAIDEFQNIADFARDTKIDLVVVASDDPLVGGLVDFLEERGIAAFGPSKAAAQLEGSKAFTKEICQEYNIPTAGFAKFRNYDAAKSYLATQPYPLVVKADGLAAGKGVFICATKAEAENALDEIMLTKKFGDSGEEIVVEEFLTGEEVSYFILTDGTTILPLASAQDHKRAFDGDTGPNTGGMGAYSPAPMFTPELEKFALEKMIKPTLQAMRDKGHPFKGVLFAGFMLTPTGLQLIEYNVRFGDPECQVILPRMVEGDLVDLMLKINAEKLHEAARPTWDPRTALTVIMAAKGYPDSYTKNTEVKNIAGAAAPEDIEIFQAGTKKDGNKILASGGRTLAVTAFGKDTKDAQTKAYAAVKEVNWDNGFYRTDIGWRAVGE